VVNFFQVVRAQALELRRLIELTPYSREEFARALESAAELTPVERARRFYVRTRQSHLGFSTNAIPSNWSTSRQDSRNGIALVASRFVSGATWFDGLANRFRGVMLENRPAVSVIAACDSANTLIYADPPYVPETWTRKDKSYAHLLNEDGHRKLAQALNTCRSLVAISGYDSTLYAELFPATSWRKIVAAPGVSHASKRPEAGSSLVQLRGRRATHPHDDGARHEVGKSNSASG
jgi:DNA adenine methylase